MMKLISRASLALFLSLYTFLAFGQAGNGYALVVIDMQEPFVTRGGHAKDVGNIKKVKEIIAEQKKMIELAKKSKIPIIFVEYENFGDTNSELKQAADGYISKKFVTKNTDGMFESYNKFKADLTTYLEAEKVGKLVITGANGGACVEESIRGALDNNYSVLAYSKGIADFNYDEFIYPYSGKYDFKPTCASCTFRETSDIEMIQTELALAPATKETDNKQVKDLSRATGKEIKKQITKQVKLPAKPAAKTKPTATKRQ